VGEPEKKWGRGKVPCGVVRDYYYYSTQHEKEKVGNRH